MRAYGKPTLRLRTEEFDKLARAILGEQSDADLAAKLGVHPVTLSQIRLGRREPSTGFIAIVKTLMPNVPVEQVFEVIEASERVA